MAGTSYDHILKPAIAARMPLVMPKLEVQIVDNACHWVVWEQRETVTTILEEWLAKITAPYHIDLL